LLLKASPPVLEKGMKGSGVTSYRSAAKRDMVSRLISSVSCATQLNPRLPPTWLVVPT
jgi:hypothetical protein